ncbi:Maf family protein [Paenibacillus athensensis]|uniref:dTTP/UTP pyrophosphatase n=1 Tax=Paenibacillus athensensis TaxID=1967502 RepID=A0A4Y8PVP3_9BACL|nr:Maf family protein [Paenibacillus athensensis]MCD1258204.1 Maf family protein [Paenibacillus athensensis]
MKPALSQTLILASSSPRRQELVRSLGLPYIIRASDVDETVEGARSPQEFVEILALRKAEAVRGMLSGTDEADGVIIGSDTIVVHRGEVLGKPADEADAYRMLEALQGAAHEVYTGLACVDIRRGRPTIQASEGATQAAVRLGDVGQFRSVAAEADAAAVTLLGYTASKVTFRPMSDQEIRAYIATGQPMDKAGAYGVQGIGSLFIEKIEGDFYSVMGLPMNLLYAMLRQLGISPFQA